MNGFGGFTSIKQPSSPSASSLTPNAAAPWMDQGSIQLDIENSIQYSIEISIEFYRVSHSTVKLNRICNRVFNTYPIELSPWSGEVGGFRRRLHACMVTASYSVHLPPLYFVN